MLSFKKWLQKENFAGPGGGPEPSPENQEDLGKNMNGHGVGAFPSFDNLPPKGPNTATSSYADERFGKKYMSKNKAKKQVRLRFPLL